MPLFWIPVLARVLPLLWVTATTALADAPPALELEGDAAAGHFTASWSPASGAAPGLEYELQEASAEGFAEPRTRYRGPHTASVLSGMPNGTYFYRVRQRPTGPAQPGPAQPGPAQPGASQPGASQPGASQPGPWSAWSQPRRFTVEHHSLRLAFSLFAMGAVVFVAILAFLTFASRQRREPGHG